jgi:hypothetical protein
MPDFDWIIGDDIEGDIPPGASAVTRTIAVSR